jgi:hypothetical protein
MLSPLTAAGPVASPTTTAPKRTASGPRSRPTAPKPQARKACSKRGNRLAPQGPTLRAFDADRPRSVCFIQAGCRVQAFSGHSIAPVMLSNSGDLFAHGDRERDVSHPPTNCETKAKKAEHLRSAAARCHRGLRSLDRAPIPLVVRLDAKLVRQVLAVSFVRRNYQRMAA